MLAVMLMVVAWALSLMPRSAHAQVVLVGDATRPYSSAFVERLKLLLPDAAIRTVETYSPQRSQEVTPQPKLIIALGAQALRETLISVRALPQGYAASTATPILSLLTTQDQYAAIVHAQNKPGAVPFVSALYGDPDPLIQLRLIQTTFRRPVSVGVWATVENAASITRLRAIAPTFDVTLAIENLVPDSGRVAISDVARATSARADVDAWLALPDAAIFDSSSLKTILLVSYARSQPMFGFTASMVTAGAAASAWVPATMLAGDVADIYRSVAKGANLPNAQYPSHYDVIVNESVLRSLSLPVAQTLRHLRRAP